MGSAKGHIGGARRPLIHIMKAGTCFDEAGKKRHDTCDYRKNCPDLAEGWQAHHVLPMKSLNAYSYESNAEDIEAAYAQTEWCMNQKENMIALPTHRVYLRRPPGAAKKAEARFGGDDPGEHPHGTFAGGLKENLPAHDFDHNTLNGYSSEVTAKLQKDVWELVQKAKSTGKHPEPEAVAVTLGKLAEHFRKELQERGKRNGGTESSLEELFFKRNDEAVQKKHAGNKLAAWWTPYSMGSDDYVEKTLAGTYAPRNRTPWIGAKPIS